MNNEYFLTICVYRRVRDKKCRVRDTVSRKSFNIFKKFLLDKFNNHKGTVKINKDSVNVYLKSNRLQNHGLCPVSCKQPTSITNRANKDLIHDATHLYIMSLGKEPCASDNTKSFFNIQLKHFWTLNDVNRKWKYATYILITMMLVFLASFSWICMQIIDLRRNIC